MDQVSQVREKIDLIALISEYLTLKKTGRNFTTTCPFHSEKTPSFVVSPERQIWHCFGCFPPGELIKTPFGYHPIQTVAENEFVVSGNGEYRKVLAVHTRNYSGDLIKIITRKIRRSVSLTGDHHVFVVRSTSKHEVKFKYFAKRYQKYLKYLVNNPEYYFKKTNKWLPIQEFEARDLMPGDLLLYPLNDRVTPVVTLDLNEYVTKHSRFGPQPTALPTVSVNEDFLKLLGYWIAEGSNHRAYIRFSLGNNEEDFAKEIVELIYKIFKVKASIYRRPSGDKTGIEVTACHAFLANAFENLCGKGATNKHIPFIFQETPSHLQKILLNAIHKGDGTQYLANKSSKTHRSITTVSKVLGEQLIDILLRLEVFPSLSVGKSEVDRNGVDHKESYTVIWSDEARLKYDLVYHKDGVRYWLLPVEKVTSRAYKGPVYNLTVNGDHSYVASHFAVSNCGKGGDAFTFLMEYENIEFPESLSILAKKAGVELVREKFNRGVSSKKERLYEVNHLANEFFHFVLTKHPAGKKALAYLEKRGVTLPLIKTFMIGFSPANNALSSYLINKKQFKADDLIEAGLSYRRGRGCVDFFKDRIMFPLSDTRGNVVGFSGRSLGESFGPKYVNTKDTIIYHKGSHFFGIHSAKEEIKKQDRALIVEGEFDVISCFKEGIKNVIAVKGTALTENQVALVSRFASKVSLCFDMDSAGQQAVARSLPILEKKGLTITVVVIVSGKDADESIRNNPFEFKQAIKHDVSVYDFLLEKALKTYDKHTAEGKRKIADEFLPFIASIQNEIVKEHYIRKMSQELATSYESIGRELSRFEKQGSEKQQVAFEQKVRKNREEMLEEYLVALIVQLSNPYEGLKRIEPYKAQITFTVSSLQKLLDCLRLYFQKKEIYILEEFTKSLPKELLPSFDTCYLFPIPKFTDITYHLSEIERTAKDIRHEYVRNQIRELSGNVEEEKLSTLVSLLKN